MVLSNYVKSNWFQHAAARRRLKDFSLQLVCLFHVSTRSRPKAAEIPFAAFRVLYIAFQHAAARRRLNKHYTQSVALAHRFNTQPPEGG